MWVGGWVDRCNLRWGNDLSLLSSGRALVSQNQGIDWGLEDSDLIFLDNIPGAERARGPQEAGLF